MNAIASQFSLQKTVTYSQPNQRYLPVSVMALIAFASIVGWKEIGPMHTPEATERAFVPVAQPRR